MIDRLICADGGNADPTSTSGKKAAKAKELGLWRRLFGTGDDHAERKKQDSSGVA